jgi:hypothetical protein
MSAASEWNVVPVCREFAGAPRFVPVELVMRGPLWRGFRTHRTYSSVFQGRIYLLVSLQVAAGEIRVWKGAFRSRSGFRGGLGFPRKK